MASARLTARRVRRSSPSLTSPKVACAHVFGDITALHSSISLSFRFTLLSQFYHFFTRTTWKQLSCLSWWLTMDLGSVRPPGLIPTRTSTRPPHPPHSAPCPYRMQDAPFPIRSATFIRRLGRKRPNGYDYPIRLAKFIRGLSEAERSAYQYFVHIADLSAWGAHRRAIGR